MLSEAREWFTRRTSASSDWDVAELLAAKSGRRVDVILPALNEAATVGAIVAAVRSELMTESCPLVDDLVVVDSRSSDDTAQQARQAGARVVTAAEVLPQYPMVTGKGEALWRGLAASTGDLVVFVDADLRSFSSDYVVGLLGPLLTDPTVQLVKAVYDRPLVAGEIRIAAGGGRVTEILARPLINALWPELAGVAQPLAGEYAARRTLLESLPFPCGYGVEIGLLVDTYRREGLAAIAQVDLGQRVHRHQDESELSRMSAQILHAALSRADPAALIHSPRRATTLPAFSHDGGRFDVAVHAVETEERPPLKTLASASRQPG